MKKTKNNKQSLIPDGINTSIYEKLRLPIFAIFAIVLIYFGLTLKDLANKQNNLIKENQALTFNLNQMSSDLTAVKNNVSTMQTASTNLQNNLTSAENQLTNAQKQIAYLTSQVSKQSATPIFTATPAVVTKTITQTVTREVEKNQATVTIQNVGSFKVDLQAGDNAFDVLKRASVQNSFPLKYDTYSFGVFVNSIGGIAPTVNQYWAFYFNGTFSNVGASDQPVQKGDSIFWQLASF